MIMESYLGMGEGHFSPASGTGASRCEPGGSPHKSGMWHRAGSLTFLEGHYGEGRKGDDDGVLAVVLGKGTGGERAAVAHVGAAEPFGIGVQNLLVEALFGDAELVALARD